MESGSARWIGWALPWGAWVRWYTTDSVRNVALIRPSVRTGAPSPQGKALVTQYNFAGWYHLKSLPLGGRWLRSRRMRATYRKQSVVY